MLYDIYHDFHFQSNVLIHMVFSSLSSFEFLYTSVLKADQNQKYGAYFFQIPSQITTIYRKILGRKHSF